MRRFREQLVPFGVLAAIVAVGVVTLGLLSSAQRSGLRALRDAKVAEVGATAASREQQTVNFLQSTSFLAAQQWDFRPNSPNDLRILESYRGPDARTGFFLLDPSDRVTQGILLEGNPIGAVFDRPGFAKARNSESYQRGVGAVLPVHSTGLTTSLPTVAVVLPVVDRTTSAYRGAFVAEIDVSPQANINAEVAKLARGEGAEFLILDTEGTVYAAADTSLLAKKLPAEYASLGKGDHNVGKRLVVVDDIPSAGWRVMFRQDRDTFESPLAQPIQDVGRLVVVVFLALGLGMFVVLLRRLRAAREEQERLRRINEAQEEFISIVSHELRTPVAGVLGFLETSLDHWSTMSDAERQTTVRRAAVNARRLQALTRDVLDTQSVETGQLAYNFESIDLAQETRAVVEAATALYHDRPIEVSAEPGSITVAGDPDRLQQVLTNLIDNAHTNAPPGTPIEISTTVDEEGALVSVRDHGPGLPAEGFERVFDKFVRTGSSSVAGTGLGLYICRRIIEAHHGRIWAENAPDGGAVFRFRIPLRGVGVGAGNGNATPASTMVR